MDNYLMEELGFKFPLYWNEWAIERKFADLLIYTILTKNPRVVVDLGSGLTTLITAKVMELKEQKDFTIYSVDCGGKFLKETENRIKAEKLNNFKNIHFIYAPLEEITIKTRKYIWYKNFSKQISESKIDLLVVDGPMGNLCKNARYPAVPLLEDKLKKKSVILLDDFNREDEQEIGKLWCAEINGKLFVREQTLRGAAEIIVNE